jgi:hypothetical protein
MSYISCLFAAPRKMRQRIVNAMLTFTQVQTSVAWLYQLAESNISYLFFSFIFLSRKP